MQIVDFSARVTLKFDGLPKKTIGNHFHAARHYVYHFIPIRKLEFELPSRNAKIRAKSFFFFFFTLCVTLKVDG